ncbi:acyl-CoA dehydrogenase [Mycobacterium pseudokansasii]|uniref:acyl-CoA dehydrogenase n=1 Tax=Mycobacterium pseudokansasii TaxID=2341080 RepID=UPI0007B50C6F|nr:acyl-CoA dehydrogenase [Mycobacterium pseudokansasii]KZS65294.1 acyl-CoA dehydrogenase [Mycobacterium kansasii]VAZ96677.1 3-methylmercaptopropionyl-CoA dehydrogenase [Mycobacterium pseudokansasii]VAZ98106.1 3-methylmercaptopropionyl-CoA dehydrogenase [Mycobacterium pseudokansasii]
MTELISRRDLEFLLYEWLDVESLTVRPRFAEHSRDTFDAVLRLSADLAGKYFVTHNKLSDSQEPTMSVDGTVAIVDEVKTALDAYVASGLLAGEFDEAVGGMQLPTTVSRASMALFQAANAATATYLALTIANANLIAAHGSEEQIARYVRPMLEGRYFGTMCLSEPQAGSSLADITTRAVRQSDGTYRLTGTKMWISGGDHDLSENIVHLVLAKTPGGGPGVNSISLFIVPKYLATECVSLPPSRNDVALAGLNHKMGMRGVTNALLSFGDGTFSPGGQAGAVGYLVGEENRGLSYMFHMMNEARIGVGFLAAALGYVGYVKSVEYARIRTQGRPRGMKDPEAPPVALVEHADVRRMLLSQKAYVEGALALVLFCARLVDEQASAATAETARDAGVLLDLLTPIAKSWPSQWCLQANDLAIQVHGGYGYTRDYDVEQHYRDNRLNPIHEGTNGIQGLDLLGRKVTLHDGAGLKLLSSYIERTARRAQSLGGEDQRWAQQLERSWERVLEVTNTLVQQRDSAAALANSSIYLECFGHVVIAWIWLDKVTKAAGRHGGFYDGKRQAARYFFIYELPKVAAQLDLLATLDATTLLMSPEWF